MTVIRHGDQDPGRRHYVYRPNKGAILFYRYLLAKFLQKFAQLLLACNVHSSVVEAVSSMVGGKALPRPTIKVR